MADCQFSHSTEQECMLMVTLKTSLIAMFETFARCYSKDFNGNVLTSYLWLKITQQYIPFGEIRIKRNPY